VTAAQYRHGGTAIKVKPGEMGMAGEASGLANQNTDAR